MKIIFERSSTSQRLGLAWSFLTFAIVAVATGRSADAAQSDDMKAIAAHAGCFDVTYNFAETFPMKPGYQIKSPYFVSSTEFVAVDQVGPNSIALQHILQTSQGSMKHWRQEWTYEGKEFFEYRGHDLWVKRRLTQPTELAGTWIQRVLNVDDSPQYECSAPWVHVGDRHYWECEGYSPLPRREYTSRADYNILDRRNRQIVIGDGQKDGWVHEQDNIKIKLVQGRTTPLVKEKGENVYKRIPLTNCDGEKKWWEENRDTWHAIQSAWNYYYSSTDRIQLLETPATMVLYTKLNELAERSQKLHLSTGQIETDAKAIIRASVAP